MDEDHRTELRSVVAGGTGPSDSGWATRVCTACVQILASIDAAALTLRTDLARVQEILGSSDPWAADLDEAQFTTGEGPGVQAFEEGEPVLVADIGSETRRWPAFADAAGAAEARAVFAFPLQSGAIRIGTLDLYRRRAGTLPWEEATDAALLSVFITEAVLADVTRAEATGQAWQPEAQPYHRVSVATGMVAAQQRIELADAFALLQGHAFAYGLTLSELAEQVIDRQIELDQ